LCGTWLPLRGEDTRVLAALWCIPFVVALQNWCFNQIFNLATLLQMAMIWLVWRWQRRARKPDTMPATPVPGT